VLINNIFKHKNKERGKGNIKTTKKKNKGGIVFRYQSNEHVRV
jgi:hypothetical protein